MNGENKVEVHRLTLGRAVGDEMIVEEGLKEGDLVIVEGIQKVRPGSLVEPSTVPPSTAGSTAPAG